MTTFSSINPATGEAVWTGATASAAEVDTAVQQARRVFNTWRRMPVDERILVLRAFARELETRAETLVEAIGREIGKPRWEARTEVRAMIGKVELSIQAYGRRCAEFRGGGAVTRFRPHGVVAVFGPFNFPGHLPNGHIVPALLAGNTVVFKPSEHAPLVAELTAAAWRAAGLPEGALVLVHGARETGAALATHPAIDGLFFTGSPRTGLWLAEQLARTPEKILALEMGGNNPLIVWPPAEVRAAALLAVQSAYVTAGQRCTCARRLIVPASGDGEAFLDELGRMVGALRVGASADDPEPYLGPVISLAAADAVLAAQQSLAAQGGRILIETKRLRPGAAFLSPGVIDVTDVPDRADEEIFGPLLQVIRVGSFELAIAEANRTRYGLAAGLVSSDPSRYPQFSDEIRAGVVNWNQPLTGASGAAPFGGIGRSGNHRPSGFFAADYCSYPVASTESAELVMPAQLPPGLIN